MAAATQAGGLAHLEIRCAVDQRLKQHVCGLLRRRGGKPDRIGHQDDTIPPGSRPRCFALVNAAGAVLLSIERDFENTRGRCIQCVEDLQDVAAKSGSSPVRVNLIENGRAEFRLSHRNGSCPEWPSVTSVRAQHVTRPRPLGGAMLPFDRRELSRSKVECGPQRPHAGLQSAPFPGEDRVWPALWRRPGDGSVTSSMQAHAIAYRNPAT